jgi:hypothetical protein
MSIGAEVAAVTGAHILREVDHDPFLLVARGAGVLVLVVVQEVLRAYQRRR